MSEQILKSQLLSGGLKLHLFAYFSCSKLEQMIVDAKEGVDNQELIASLEKSVKHVKDDANFLTEMEIMLLQIIYEGQNETIDKICKSLQMVLKM